MEEQGILLVPQAPSPSSSSEMETTSILPSPTEPNRHRNALRYWILLRYTNPNLARQILEILAPLEYLGKIRICSATGRWAIVRILVYSQCLALLITRDGIMNVIHLPTGKLVGYPYSIHDHIHKIQLHESNKWMLLTSWQTRTRIYCYKLQDEHETRLKTTFPYIVHSKTWDFGFDHIIQHFSVQKNYCLVKTISRYLFFKFNVHTMDRDLNMVTINIPGCVFSQLSRLPQFPLHIWCQRLTNQINPVMYVQRQTMQDTNLISCGPRYFYHKLKIEKLIECEEAQRFITCDRHTIRILDFEGNVHHKFKRHTNHITSMFIRFPYFVSCSMDKTVRFYNLLQGIELTEKIQHTSKQPFSLWWMDNRLIIGYSNSSVDIISVNL